MSRTFPLESNCRLGMFELIRTAVAIVISLENWQLEGESACWSYRTSKFNSKS